MKKLLIIAFILYSTSAMASPFLVSDPNPGVTLYKLTKSAGGVIESITCAPEADGSVKADVASVKEGLNTITVTACSTAPVWDEVCNEPVGFSFTKPTQPNATKNLRLIQ